MPPPPQLLNLKKLFYSILVISILSSCNNQPHTGPPTPEAIETRVLSILEKFDRVDPAQLSGQAHLINDLGLDSLDVVECVIALEEDFNIQAPAEDAEAVNTVADAVALIQKWHA
eukprot:UC1_evm1s808